MKILVTGATGFLGRSLMRQPHTTQRIGCGRQASADFGPNYLQIDLADATSMRRAVDSVRPDWVVHTAALTAVDRCETEREDARGVNLEIVSRVLEACAAFGAGLVQLSTDYVFDGRNGPYAETDATNPLSYYGQIKLESEALVLNAEVPGIVLRTLWLYGYIPHTRPNLVTWPLAALQQGQVLNIVDDQWGNPTLVDDLAMAILDLCCQNGRGVFHMGGGTYLTRFELVVELARFFGFREELVQPISTAEAGQQARRPLKSGLKTERLAAALGRSPLGFLEGVERLATLSEFKRDFPNLRSQ